MFIFVFFNAKQHLPIFSDIFAVAANKFHSGPRRYIRRHDICNFALNNAKAIGLDVEVR